MIVSPDPRVRGLVRCGLLAVCLSGFSGCDAPATGHPAVGRKVGRLPLVSLVDRSRPLPDFRGKVTLLNFWGTWCPPCRRELPGLVRLAARLRDEPLFQLVAVSCGGRAPEDLDDLAETTRVFLDDTIKPAERQAIEPWGDPDGRTRQIAAVLYGFDAFPTTYLVGADATIRRTWVGYRSGDEAEMARAIVVALKEAAVSPRESPEAPSDVR